MTRAGRAGIFADMNIRLQAANLNGLAAVLACLISLSAAVFGAAQKQDSESDPLARVREAIRKTGCGETSAGQTESALPRSDDMAAVLSAAHDYIAQPAARALAAKLQFKPRYRDPADVTKTIPPPRILRLAPPPPGQRDRDGRDQTE